MSYIITLLSISVHYTAWQPPQITNRNSQKLHLKVERSGVVRKCLARYADLNLSRSYAFIKSCCTAHSMKGFFFLIAGRVKSKRKSDTVCWYAIHRTRVSNNLNTFVNLPDVHIMKVMFRVSCPLYCSSANQTARFVSRDIFTSMHMVKFRCLFALVSTPGNLGRTFLNRLINWR